MLTQQMKQMLVVFLAMLGMTQSVAAADFKDFSVIVNNQDGTLLTAEEQSQGTAVAFGVAVAADGKVNRVAADDANAVATVSGKYHSEHGCTALKVVVPNVTNVKITVGQCTYSGKTITVTDAQGNEVTSKTPSSPGCWKNDRNNVDLLYYTGEATTLTITGMDYCPYVAVSALTEDEIAQLNTEFTLTYFDIDGTTSIGIQKVKGQTAIGEFAFGENDITKLLGVVFRGWFNAPKGGKKVKVTDKVEGDMSLYAVVTPMETAIAGTAYAYDLTTDAFDPADHECIEIADGGYYYNTHGWTFGPGQTIKLLVAGDATITVGGCAYSSGEAITITDAEGKTVGTVSGKNDSDGGQNTFEYEGPATVLTLTFGGRDYIHSVAIVNHGKSEGDDHELATLDNEPVTANFAFGAGVYGQQAEFGDATKYFVTSKVTYGSNLFIKDANMNQTRFEPLTQQNEGESGTAADESNAIKFLIQPNFGLTFTPKKVSLKTTRFGTDNGLLDFSWMNPDKSTVSLAVGVKPKRNNDSPNYTEVSYDITGATPAEGTCGLVVNLYHLQSGKQIGFGEIVIEGTLSGQEKEVPVLATVTINGTEFTAEKVFGDAYEAEMELSKKVDMVSETNPIEATAKKGEVGIIGYVGDETKCVVTIPMTQGETTVNYVLTLVQKPDFKLTYIDTDKKTVLGEFKREKDEAIGEFDLDYAEATAEEGMKVRGWFIKTAGGEKYTAETVVTGNINLYAVATEIETVSNSKKYIFDLTDKLFDAADHEAFNPSGSFYWHDNQHGWAFKADDNNKIDLLVGPKATISLTLCRYGAADNIDILDATGKKIGTLPGMNKEDVDGEIVAFNYEGEGGTITLKLNTTGEMYLHGVKIVNTAETNYESQGRWYFVKPGSAESLLDVLDIVNGTNAAKDAERSFIYLPNGTYDLNETVKTLISGHNISIIGQSMDKTIIVTAPDKSIEGLGKADMFQASGSNLYLQDLTLKNALDYYNAGSAGRAAVLQDSGNRTIGKRVRMLSYQDTYYPSNSNQQAYWEDCDIHGTVDFICGGGDIRFQNTTISLEPRALDGKGGRTVTAPTTVTKFGYVFDNCKVVDLAEGKGDWNFGRTWQKEPICIWLNTTLDENAQKTLVSSRWTQKGMNNTDPKIFGEYGTKDVNGTDITPKSNKITSFGGSFETILTADQAATYTYDMMFKNNIENPWDPASLTAQMAAPTNVKLAGTKLIWSAAKDVETWVIFKNGQIFGIANAPEFTVDDANAVYAVRAANKMGGLSEATSTPAIAVLADTYYGTFYDSENSYALPKGLKAYVVTSGTEDQLTYVQLTDAIPAGTAVLLKGEKNHGKKYELTVTKAEPYVGHNLLVGSDVNTLTYSLIKMPCLFYKLAYGPSNTKYARTFGWYWGAEEGEAFEIEGHRAWLAIPKTVTSARSYPIDNNDGATGIEQPTADNDTTDEIYNLNGQRVAAPTKGLYIRNNKKVIIK
ncbi:MAG: InlB B-repeat-containing protein [Prevotella sp.]|nr:InlB B-repeat-containing protein [Prevotella sp.]